MKPKNMVLRCYAERQGSIWVTVCIDLCLAAQADSLQEAKDKMHEQVREYLEDAFGQHSDYFEDLMFRPAPLSQILKYHFIRCRKKMSIASASMADSIFKERLPMRPC
ncbi:hypothetical protein [Zhongshania sp.]|jgi:hypothetical protein|uniref:hypothetical protein n=1 Tax=Zhongshania sp. TaxID=1971902 RepID=UPI001B3F7B5C|nr:hypothetical protein [Zhongshania sp.]MBQ0795552.1 hypothetical protein [Zhongshania sp.]